jgi:hypothetical protein
MYQPIQFKTATPPVRYSTSRLPLRRGFLLISLVLWCFAPLRPAHAQLPAVFAADNPSGSISSGGANIAYIQNTTSSDITFALDANTITAKANRLNIFDRSSGVWVRKVVLNQQSQPIATSAFTSTTNNFLTGLYAYYKMDEASGSGAIDSANGRNLVQTNGQGIVGSAAGVINTSRYFPGSPCLFRQSSTDFSPRANHFFATFWAKAATLSQLNDASFLGKFSVSASDAEWLVYFDNTTKRARFSVSANGSTITTSVEATTAFANTSNWYFFAIGWDGANTKISVNGGPYATTGFFGPVFSGTGIMFCIGSEGGSQPWNGQIDEVAIWIGRNDLTISEVQQLYNGGAGLPFSSFQ